MELLQQADELFLKLVNRHLVHPAADHFMVSVSSPGLSGAVVLLAALFVVVYRGKQGVLILFLAVLAACAAGVVTSGILKPLAGRPRPCFELEWCRLLIEAPRSFSFASTHASVSAASAAVIRICFTGGGLTERLFSGVAIGYALIVSWSRMYVGVHYPSDVLVGILIGAGCGAVVYLCCSWWFKNVVQVGYLRNAKRG